MPCLGCVCSTPNPQPPPVPPAACSPKFTLGLRSRYTRPASYHSGTSAPPRCSSCGKQVGRQQRR